MRERSSGSGSGSGNSKGSKSGIGFYQLVFRPPIIAAIPIVHSEIPK